MSWSKKRSTFVICLRTGASQRGRRNLLNSEMNSRSEQSIAY